MNNVANEIIGKSRLTDYFLSRNDFIDSKYALFEYNRSTRKYISVISLEVDDYWLMYESIYYTNILETQHDNLRIIRNKLEEK